MIEFMVRYLGFPVSTLLNDVPFKAWEYERLVEDDLEPPVVGFNFPEKGLEINCDISENIKSIFMHTDDFGVESASQSNSLFLCDRKKILDIFWHSIQKRRANTTSYTWESGGMGSLSD